MANQVSSSSGLTVLSHHDLGGRPDGMQVVREGDFLYVGHTGTTGAGTSILDVSDPAEPKLAEQWPAPANSHTHKVQVADGLLLVNHEKFPYRKPPAGPVSAGLAIYRLDDPAHPERMGFWSCGGSGVHRVVWTGGRYVHMSATPEGYRDRIWMVLDIADPTTPVEVARWSWPGQRIGEEPTWPAGKRYAAHHALIDGTRAYLGFDDGGMVVLDVSDLTDPTMVTRLEWGGGATHTCLPLPGRGLVVVTDEQQYDGPDAPERTIRIVDVSGEPAVLSKVPAPAGDFAGLPLRFGAHNLHENRAGSYRSERIVFATYFSAGLRVYDLADPERPTEIAHWVGDAPAGQPVPQSNDLWVEADGLVWVTDRIGGGLTALRPDSALRDRLGEARAA
ncbi:MAG TPA: hypothetical protein VFW65_22940 [Pseudonocardiaceae bacterium]|nr:hypothetical protein [Pseudonocardiaceae bacterium]